LAGAYEQQENKHFAVTNYKEALVRNPECFEAL
jgi:tetratricopeptide (TPR) repeat protein